VVDGIGLRQRDYQNSRNENGEQADEAERLHKHLDLSIET
jgi:hypothetical protein